MSTTGDPRLKQHLAWSESFRQVKHVAGASRPGKKSSANGALSRLAPVTSGLEPYTGPWTATQAAHLIRRTMFGVKLADLKYMSSLTMLQAVNEILTSSPLPSVPVNNYEGVDANAHDPTVAFGQPWYLAPQGGQIEGYRITSLKGWVNQNMIQQVTSIHEKMKFFWSNLLPAKWWDVNISKTGLAYYQTLHKHALGNYRALIKAITLDPSMLIFLNGQANNKDAPDENYGRELQELFCIGKGPDSHYTESDVKAAARVLTGWQINWDAYSYPGDFHAHFESTIHDTADKQFSSFYGNKIISGRTGANGALETDELIDMILGTEECARYICRRIYTFFVYNEIDSATEQNVIIPLAAIFRTNNFEILPVLDVLFKSAHFFDTANVGALIKSPLDHVMGVWRALGADTFSNATLNNQYLFHQSLHWHMAAQGLEPGDPPNVAGWPAYYQEPSYDKIWISTDTVTRRATTTDALTTYGYYYFTNQYVAADLIAFASQFDHPEDPNLLVSDASKLLFGLALSDGEITNLKSLLLSGQVTDNYWTQAWLTYTGNHLDAAAKQIVLTRLQTMFRSLMQIGEYHLM